MSVIAMNKRIRHVRESRVCFQSRIAMAIFLLCCGCLLAGQVLAGEQTAGGEHQIQLTLNQLLGPQQAARYRDIIPADEVLGWELYLPDNDLSERPGVFVYVSPRNSGKIDPRWRAVMDQQNLVYIAARDSGNRKPVNRRMVLAIMAIRALARKIPFASDRIIVSGFSGGGRVASMLASQYPGAFSGALYICGVNPFKKKTTDVERLAQNRFVFLSGTRDFNLADTRRVYHQYLATGAQSKLMVVRDMTHELPDTKVLTEALEFLQ